MINNVGEALVAKRRSDAVIVSHLTPPFMEAGLYGDLSLLHDKIHDWEQLEDPLLREETLRSATKLVRDLKLAVDLDLNESEIADRLLTEEELTAVHNYIHQLKDQSVTDGLHVIGRELDDLQVHQTVTAMVGDQGIDQIVKAVQLNSGDDEMEYRQELTGRLSPMFSPVNSRRPACFPTRNERCSRSRSPPHKPRTRSRVQPATITRHRWSPGYRNTTRGSRSD